MKVYRWQYIDYNPEIEDGHRLLLDTLNYNMSKYPCPQEIEIFRNDTRSCFKTKKLAEEFKEDMDETWYNSEIDEYEDNQAPEFYELLEYEVSKDVIVFIDDFQIIHEIEKIK